MVWFAFKNTAFTTVYWMNNNDINDWPIKGNTF